MTVTPVAQRIVRQFLRVCLKEAQQSGTDHIAIGIDNLRLVLDALDAASPIRIEAQSPPDVAKQFAVETWGDTWAHAEMDSLMEFAALVGVLSESFGAKIPVTETSISAESDVAVTDEATQ